MRDTKKQDTMFILDDLIKYLNKNDLSITNRDDHWREVGHALKNELGEDLGYKYFQKFSRMDDRSSEEMKIQFFSVSKLSSATLGTILYLAMEQGYKIPEMSKAKQTRLKNNIAFSLINDADTDIRHNVVKGIIEYKKEEVWTRVNDSDLCHIYINVLKNLFLKDYCADWLYAQAPVWNPTQEFLNFIHGISGDEIMQFYNLAEQYVDSIEGIDREHEQDSDVDDTDYIAELASTLKSSNPDMTYSLLRKWLIGFVGSLKDEKTYNENILVLQGDQGIGKTRWVRKLIPDQWDEYLLCRNVDPSNKDHMISLSENFIIYMDELDTIVNRKASIEAFKALTSLDKVSVRKPYDRFNTESPRLASFIGSLNNKEFLKDPTGNRRFFVIGVDEINYDHDVDMIKVYKQALAAYNAGEPYYLTNEEIEELNINNQEFEATNLYDELISKYFESDGSEHLSTLEMLQYINNSEAISNPGTPAPLDSKMISYMGTRLKKLGFTQKMVKVNGKSKRSYAVKLLDQISNTEQDETIPVEKGLF